MPKIIAERPGQQLEQTGTDTGRIIDTATGKKGPEMPIQSILARGYWAEVKK